LSVLAERAEPPLPFPSINRFYSHLLYRSLKIGCFALLVNRVFPVPSGGVPSPHLSCFPCEKLHVGVHWLPEYMPQTHSILPPASCGSELQVDD